MARPYRLEGEHVFYHITSRGDDRKRLKLSGLSRPFLRKFKVKIYLDVCCLSRPFDNQTQEKIHLETEAILSILNQNQKGRWHRISSEVIEAEIFKTPDLEKKVKVSIFASIYNFYIKLDEVVEKRAAELENLGIGAYDALHIVCAEKAKAEVLSAYAEDHGFTRG